jgi:hypothetical protein
MSRHSNEFLEKEKEILNKKSQGEKTVLLVLLRNGRKYCLCQNSYEIFRFLFLKNIKSLVVLVMHYYQNLISLQSKIKNGGCDNRRD